MAGEVPAIMLQKMAERAKPKPPATEPNAAKADEDLLRRGLRGRRALQGNYGELGFMAPLGANPQRG